MKTFRKQLGIGLSLIISLMFCGVSSSVSAQQSSSVAKLSPMDYIEIYQLYSAYALALDTGNGPGRVATFTPDGTFASYISKHVPESMDILMKRTNAYGQRERPGGMRHNLVNIHITPTASGADGSCYALLYGGKTDASGNFIGNPGFYKDTLVKTSAGWRFKTREVWIVGQ